MSGAAGMASDGRARGQRSRSRRVWFLVGAAGALLVLGAILVGPPGNPGASPLTSRAPEGFLALARFLREMGIEVRERDVPPDPPGTFVLLEDVRAQAQEAPLLEWASRGGRLVVADPRSSLAELLGVSTSGPIGGILGTTTLTPGCVAPEAVRVTSIVARVSDFALRADGPAATACFPGARGSLVVNEPRGSGEVFLLGGSSPLTNDLLDRRDNADFALAIIGDGGPVTFGPPLARSQIEASKSLWALLPTRAKAAILALVLAAAAFALVRGRRLGKPGQETPISPLPASELVVATAKLYRAARARAYCGQLLREGTAARLARRARLPVSASPEELALALGAAEDERRIERLLTGPEPRTDEELIALGRELEDLRARVEETRP